MVLSSFSTIFSMFNFVCFSDPKNELFYNKNMGKESKSIKIRPYLSYYVYRGLETGLAVPKAPHIMKLTFCTVFKLFENDPFLKPFFKPKNSFHRSWNRLETCLVIYQFHFYPNKFFILNGFKKMLEKLLKEAT